MVRNHTGNAFVVTSCTQQYPQGMNAPFDRRQDSEPLILLVHLLLLVLLVLLLLRVCLLKLHDTEHSHMQGTTQQGGVNETACGIPGAGCKAWSAVKPRPVDMFFSDGGQSHVSRPYSLVSRIIVGIQVSQLHSEPTSAHENKPNWAVEVCRIHQKQTTMYLERTHSSLFVPVPGLTPSAARPSPWISRSSVSARCVTSQR